MCPKIHLIRRKNWNMFRSWQINQKKNRDGIECFFVDNTMLWKSNCHVLSVSHQCYPCVSVSDSDV